MDRYELWSNNSLEYKKFTSFKKAKTYVENNNKKYGYKRSFTFYDLKKDKPIYPKEKIKNQEHKKSLINSGWLIR